MAISQPSAASVSAMARPMPRVPPVMIAFLPLSPRSMMQPFPCACVLIVKSIWAHFIGQRREVNDAWKGRQRITSDQFDAFFLRVAAAFFAEAERAEAGRFAEASPPLRPPFREAAMLSFDPRPEPDFLPPPSSLLTVAQARRSASSLPTPFSRYPSSICSALRFCLSV